MGPVIRKQTKPFKPPNIRQPCLERAKEIKSKYMSSPIDAPVHLSGDGSVVEGAPIFSAEEPQVSDYPSPTPIYVSGEGLSPDQLEKENGKPFEGDYMPSDGSVLPPLSEMQPEEGVALRDWRRQNTIRIEEKEKMEKELLNQILDEADDYKINFHNKRKTICDNNIATNREREKVYLAGWEKFHAEADKSYWKAIADLIPKEVPVIENRGTKKDQDKKLSVVVIQGPKPGKPTELSRMRQILLKLKHNAPNHLKHSPPPPAVARDIKDDAATAPPAEAVAVA